MDKYKTLYKHYKHFSQMQFMKYAKPLNHREKNKIKSTHGTNFKVATFHLATLDIKHHQPNR